MSGNQIVESIMFPYHTINKWTDNGKAQDKI